MRKRLTSKRLRAERQEDGIFPGDIGNMERKKNYHDVDAWDNEASEFKGGWDLREDYETCDRNFRDRRDPDTNIGVKKAKAFRKATKAVRLAQMLLGDEADDSEIREQAKDFMGMEYGSICSSIKRFRANGICCEDGVCQPCDEPDAEVDADDEDIDELSEPPVEADEEDCVEADEDELGDVPESPVEADEEEAPDMVLDIPDAPVAGEAEGIFNPESELNQSKSDPALEAMFADGEEDELDEPVVAKKRGSKRGIKHLAATPKLASKEPSDVRELANVWTGLNVPGL